MNLKVYFQCGEFFLYRALIDHILYVIGEKEPKTAASPSKKSPAVAVDSSNSFSVSVDEDAPRQKRSGCGHAFALLIDDRGQGS